MFPRHLVIAYSHVFFYSAVVGSYGWLSNSTGHITGAALLSIIGCMLRLSGLYWPEQMERVLTMRLN